MATATAPSPEATVTVVGNEPLLERLHRDVCNGSLSHAYILEGRPGSGRHTIARHLCATIACHNRPNRSFHDADDDQIGMFADEPAPVRLIPEGAPLPCGECPACRKVLEGTCPDIRIIGREGKATIGVDAVRFFRGDVLTPPNELDTKIYIIEDADAMTVQAQNALLLTLEEPPPYVLFLLLCSGTEALLETIRSRAPTLRTSPIADKDIRTYLKDHNRRVSDEDMAAILLRADGCIGQALTLTDARAIKPILKMRELTDEFIGICANRRADQMTVLLTKFGNKRDAITDTIGMMDLAIRDLILVRHGEGVMLKYYTNPEIALDIAYRFTTRTLLRIHNALSRAAESIRQNANVRLALMQMAVEIGIL